MIFLTKILSFLMGGGFQAFATELRLVKLDKLNAANDTDRILAEQNIVRLEAVVALQTKGDFTWLPKVVRAIWAAPYIWYIWKLIVNDKILKLGTTDPLGQYELGVGAIIVSYYFLPAMVNRMRGK